MASITDLQTIDWAASARTFFDDSDSAMFVFQPQDLQLVKVNACAEQWMGISWSQVSNFRVDELLESDDSDSFADLIAACRARQSFATAESVWLRRSQRGPLEVNVTVGQLPAEPEPLGLLIVREIDASDNLHRELRETNTRLVQQREAQYRLLVENAPLCIHSIDVQRRLSSINPAGTAMMGARDPGELIGRDYLSFIDQTDRERIERLLTEAYQGHTADFEFTCLTETGKRRFKSNFIPITDADGEVKKVIGTTEDITGRVQALQQLRINSRALAVADVGIVIADARLDDVPIVYCNAAFQRITGYPQQEVLGRNCRFLQAHDQGQPGAEELSEALSAQRECTVLLRNYRKDGTMFWNELSISPVRDESGVVTHFAGFSKDISARVAAESQLRDSEVRFRTLCRDAPLGIFLTDVDGRCNYVNEIGARICGQSRQAIYGDGWVRTLHPDDRSRIVKAWKAAVRKQQKFELEARFCHADGSITWGHVWANPHLSDQGEAIGYVGSIVDVTERKQALRELEESERRYRTLVEDAPEAIMVVDMDDGRFVDWNDATLKLFRSDAETIAGKFLWDFFPEKQPDGRDSSEAAKEVMRASLGGESPAFEWMHVDSAGNEIPCEIRLTGLMFGDRQLVRGTVTDISQRIADQRQLRRTRLAVESTSDAMFVINEQGQFIDVNQTACDRLGYRRDELLTMTVSDINPNYPMEAWPGHWRDLKEAKKAVYESVHLKKDGTSIPVEISKSFATVGGEEFAFAFVRDITERKKVETLLESTQFAVDNNVSAIVRINSAGRLIYVNHAACQDLQYSRDELLSMHIWDIDLNWPEDDWLDRWNQIKHAGSSMIETMHRRKDGSVVDCEVTACYVSFDGEDFVFAFCVDITDRKQAQQRLRQRETQLAHVSRLSTMGEMVAGIAHEVNQPLYSILNFSKATKNNLANPTEKNLQQIATWNHQITEAATRAGGIIKRLRAFVSQEPVECSDVEVHSLIKDALELVAYEIKQANVTIQTDFCPGSVVVLADRVQTQQVLVNLLINAVEAMERSNPETRRIAVRTRKYEQYIEVAVSDSGPGFHDCNERTLFDPFMSTKDGGMGMGLAISKTIIESFGGRLTVESDKNEGATFLFTLPLAKNHV